MMYARQGDAAVPMVYTPEDAAANPMYARADVASNPMYARKDEEPKMYYDQQSSLYARKEDEPANAMYARKEDVAGMYARKEDDAMYANAMYAARAGEAAAVEPHHSARLFAIQVTTTTIQIITTTKTSTKSSLCASLLNVTGACRRRRRGVDKPIVLSFDEEDQIDLYKPSEVQQIEPTPLAQLDAPYMSYGNLESSASDPVELDIIGLEGDCVLPRRFPLINGVLSAFNITLRYTTTLTATLTTTTTITNGTKPFFVSGCTPSPFLYSTC